MRIGQPFRQRDFAEEPAGFGQMPRRNASGGRHVVRLHLPTYAMFQHMEQSGQPGSISPSTSATSEA